MQSLLCFLGAYIVGAFPTGWIIARLSGVKNIRQHGSGATGATNVARTLGVGFFIPVFLIDAGKAFGFLYLMRYMCPASDYVLVYALVLLVGNTRSIFLKFGGGKGVATGVGILAALYPAMLVLGFIVWVVAYAVTKTVGMASVFALLALPLCAVALHADIVMTMFLSLFSLWSVYLHRKNIKLYLAEY